MNYYHRQVDTVNPNLPPTDVKGLQRDALHISIFTGCVKVTPFMLAVMYAKASQNRRAGGCASHHGPEY
jgi:hypothetical protein